MSAKIPTATTEEPSSHGHQHGHEHCHDHDLTHIHVQRDRRSLIIAMLCTGSIFIVQAIGSVLSNSLALRSDSGHMLVDFASLLIAYIGLGLAGRKDNNKQFTYGWRRVEILAALFNGIILLGMCGFILYEASYRFFGHTEEVHAHEMTYVAVFGLVANAIALYYLSDSKHLTTRSAYLHVLTDLLSSAAVVGGGIVLYFTKLEIIDTILSIVITAFIARSAYILVRRASVILMESTPEHISIDKVNTIIASNIGVQTVHDIHVWQIGSDSYAMSAHVVVDDTLAERDVLLAKLRQELHSAFSLHQITIQFESSEQQHLHPCSVSTTS